MADSGSVVFAVRSAGGVPAATPGGRILRAGGSPSGFADPLFFRQDCRIPGDKRGAVGWTFYR